MTILGRWKRWWLSLGWGHTECSRTKGNGGGGKGKDNRWLTTLLCSCCTTSHKLSPLKRQYPSSNASMGQSHGWGWLGPLLRWKSRGCWGDQVIWGLGVPFELTGCWRNLVPCLAGLRAMFSYRLSADSCSQPLTAPCHPLPCGPLHHTAVCFFKTSRRISLFIWLRGSFLESSQKRDSLIILAGDGHLGDHLRRVSATVVNSVKRKEWQRTRW